MEKNHQSNYSDVQGLMGNRIIQSKYVSRPKKKPLWKFQKGL